MDCRNRWLQMRQARASGMVRSRGQGRPLRVPTRWLLLILCLLDRSAAPASAIEATWTPNDSDGEGGPLPLSQQRRDQLNQLEQVIRSSPDPQAALERAAQSVGMDPRELLGLLEQNYRANQLVAAEARAPKATKRLLGLASAAVRAVVHTSRRHPLRAAAAAGLLAGGTYVAHTAPRTGTVLSARRGPLSKGPTTIFRPPAAYLRDCMDDDDEEDARRQDTPSRRWTPKNWREQIDQLSIESDGKQWHIMDVKPKSKSALRLLQAASCQVTVDLRQSDGDQGEDGEDDADEERSDLVAAVAWEQAAAILRTQLLTERVPGHAVRLVTAREEEDGDEAANRMAILVVKGLGDWNRYGLVELDVWDQNLEDLDELYMSLGTTSHTGHFDGLVHFSIATTSIASKLAVKVYVLIPKGGHKISRNEALKIVESLAQSIAFSIEKRTKQTLARRRQSKVFSKSAKELAQARRHTRRNKEQLMEEMATDRRRRWQRTNPNAGHYRPSGIRQQSPNNAMH